MTSFVERLLWFFLFVCLFVFNRTKVVELLPGSIFRTTHKSNICVEEKGAAHINWEPSALLKLPRKLTKSPHKLLFRWTFP